MSTREQKNISGEPTPFRNRSITERIRHAKSPNNTAQRGMDYAKKAVIIAISNAKNACSDGEPT
jgi:hypothetical protein